MGYFMEGNLVFIKQSSSNSLLQTIIYRIPFSHRFTGFISDRVCSIKTLMVKSSINHGQNQLVSGDSIDKYSP